MKIGYVQTSPIFGDKQKNFHMTAALLAGTKAELLVLPELFATGYAFVSQAEAHSLSEEADGPTAAFLHKMACQTGAVMVAGFIEREAGQIFNAALIVSPQGLLGTYRKLHLFNKEKVWFAAGDRPLRIYEVAGTKVGIMICFDWFFPETARSLALSGAELVAHPANLVLPYCQKAMVTRCLENRIFAVTANRIGREKRGEDDFTFTGASQITAYNGEVLASGPAQETAVNVVAVDIAKASQKKINAFNDLLGDRRILLYSGFQRSEDWETEKKRLLEVLDINKALNSRQDVASLLTLILDKAIAMIQAERGFIIMAPATKIAVARNFDQEAIDDAEAKISHSLARSVMSSQVPIITGNAQQDPKIQLTGSIRNLSLKSVVCLPLLAKTDVLGVLYLDNRFCKSAFDEKSIYLLKAFADQAALAIHNARLIEALEKRRLEMEKLIARLDEEVASKSLELRQVACALATKEEALSGSYSLGQMVSVSSALKSVFEIARRAASSEATVLITGESGTGKGVLAQAIHNLSNRGGPFVAENCAAIAETLLESELFGYVRGAFTGANCDRKGLFVLANDGTLFLDEIGEMSQGMQSKLLRVLEESAVRPVGSTRVEPIRVRIICATNRNLAEMTKNKEFREDLWYRLKVIAIHLPPLRDHLEDIPLLVAHFLGKYPEAVNKQIQKIEPGALELLCEHHWPGNVRQLEQELKRIVALKDSGGKICAADLSPEISHSGHLLISPRLTLQEAVARFEHNYILQAISDHDGNKSEAAKTLNISRRSLYNKLSRED